MASRLDAASKAKNLVSITIVSLSFESINIIIDQFSTYLLYFY